MFQKNEGACLRGGGGPLRDMLSFRDHSSRYVHVCTSCACKRMRTHTHTHSRDLGLTIFVHGGLDPAHVAHNPLHRLAGYCTNTLQSYRSELRCAAHQLQQWHLFYSALIRCHRFNFRLLIISTCTYRTPPRLPTCHLFARPHCRPSTLAGRAGWSRPQEVFRFASLS